LKPEYSLAVDIGGTFTDIVLRGSDGRLVVDKTLTTPKALLDGFFTGVQAVLKKAGLTPPDINGVVVHATTVVTNALIERKGEVTAMLVTEGFRDVLSIRNEHRYEMYDPQIEFSPPLVPRELTYGVPERTLAGGEVAAVPVRKAVEAIAGKMIQAGVKSVAVCLLNSYCNPANERAIAVVLREKMPDLFISLSSDVAPQIRVSPCFHHRDQCVYDADLAALPAQPGCALEGGRIRQRAPDHALLGRHHRRRGGGAQPGAHDRKRACRRRAGGQPLCGSAGPEPPDVLRHGRYHRQGLPDRRLQTAGDRLVRG
jgi:hypothetical protein